MFRGLLIELDIGRGFIYSTLAVASPRENNDISQLERKGENCLNPPICNRSYVGNVSDSCK